MRPARLPAVGRTRKTHPHLPRRVYVKHGAFYFVTRSGKWIQLGHTEREAMRTYALQISDRPAGTMGEVIQRWRTERLPDLSPRTQDDYSRSLILIERAFGHMLPGEIETQHVTAYRDKRAKKTAPPKDAKGSKRPRGSKTQANHDLAVLSQLFQAAAEWGYCSVNPCREVKRYKLKGRDRVVTDKELDAWLAWAPELLACYTLFEYATGLRQGDILAMRKDGFVDEGIPVRTRKTGKRGVIQWTPALRECVARIRALPRPVSGMYLFCTRQGKPYTGDGFRSIMQRYQRQAIEQGILADRFTSWDIRAKHAMDAERQGLDPTDQLLHEDPRTTKTYLRERAAIHMMPLAWEGKG